MALVAKNLPANAGDAGAMGLIPGLGRSPGGGSGNPLQLFLPGEFHGQRSLWATVRGVTESHTRLGPGHRQRNGCPTLRTY